MHVQQMYICRTKQSYKCMRFWYNRSMHCFLFDIFSIRVKSLRLPTSELTRRFSGLEVALEKIIFNIGKSRSRMTSGEFDLDSSFVNIFGIEKLFMNVDFCLFGRNLGESTLVRFFAHWFFVAFFIEFLDSFNEANKSKNSPPPAPRLFLF